MAASTQPILYLPLDTNESLPLSGTAHGTTIEPDDTFVHCLYLDGTDYLEFPDNKKLRIKQYTVEVWIRPDGLPGTFKCVLGKPGRNYNIWLTQKGYIYHRFHIEGNTNAGAPDTPDSSINCNNTWNHVAITNDGTTAKTYINGVEMASGPVGGNLIVDNTSLWIGLDRLESNRWFNGRMAHVRIYNRALTQDEILADMAADLGLQTDDGQLKFGASYPVSFRLLDDNHESVLYTLGGAQTLTLEVINTSRGDITPTKPDNTKASKDNHHLALCFRPGTLDRLDGISLKSAKLGTTTLKAGDWSLAHGTEQDNVDCLYLLWTKPQALAPLQKLNLALQNVSVDASGGSRSTNVELRYGQLKMAGLPLSGSRENHLNVLNQFLGGITSLEKLDDKLSAQLNQKTSGLQTQQDVDTAITHRISGLATQTYVDEKVKGFASDLLTTVNELEQIRDDVMPPLRAEIIDGWETVLNTSGETTLTLRLSPNPDYGADHTIPLTKKDSKIFLHADTNLLTIKDPSGVSVDTTNFEAQQQGTIEGFACVYPKKDVTLKHGTNLPHLDVTLTVSFNSSASLKACLSRLRVHCVNITDPDSTKHPKAFYPDFNIWVPIRIGPLVVDNSGNVGIGTTDPKHALHIKGNVTKSNPVLFLEPSQWTTHGDYGELRFGDANHYIRGEFAKGMTIHDMNGIALTGGNVGIGTTSPQSTLSVSGGVAIGSSYVTKNAGANSLIVEGNVGIGTTTPGAKLHVRYPGSDTLKKPSGT